MRYQSDSLVALYGRRAFWAAAGLALVTSAGVQTARAQDAVQTLTDVAAKAQESAAQTQSAVTTKAQDGAKTEATPGTVPRKTITIEPGRAGP